MGFRRAVKAEMTMVFHRRAIFFAMGCVLLACAACSPRHLVVDQMTEMVQTGMSAFEQDDDLTLVEQAIPANIKLLEVLLANRPDHPGLLVLLARLYGNDAFAFAEDRLEAESLRPDNPASGQDGSARNDRIEALRTRADGYYRKGLEYAIRAMAVRHPDCRERLKNLRTSAGFFESLKKEDVPALFWYAFNLGGHVNLNRHSVRVLAQAHLAEKAAKRVIDLDPAYFYGGAHLFLMVYYASRPPMMGGNLPAARDHYRQLKAVAGSDFLLAELIYGRFYLVQVGDRKAFEAALQAVIEAPPGPDRYRLYNAVARKRAQRYLDAADRFFE
ncbi:MAG: hypothetical protein JEZ11_18820 [Desulfobacterales bacterium]|nr:hypothetical protein [Desulfobacterales bacterium]